MNKLLSIGAVLSLMFGAGIERGEASAGREQPAERTRTITVHLQTLASSLGTLAGRDVHVPGLQVGTILSPQAFVVTDGIPRGARALVLLDRPLERPLVEGVEVELWGRAYTLAGASAKAGWPEELTTEAVAAFRGVPVVLADAVHAPGGVELYRRSAP